MLSKTQLIALMQGAKDERAAQIYEAAINNPFEIQVLTLDLTTAQDEYAQSGKHINFPFKSIIMLTASDNVSTVSVKFNSNDSGVAKVPFVWNQSQSSSLMYSGAYLSWTAQAGKTVTLVVGVTSDITSGQLINAGTVAVSATSQQITSTIKVQQSAATAPTIGFTIPVGSVGKVVCSMHGAYNGAANPFATLKDSGGNIIWSAALQGFATANFYLSCQSVELSLPADTYTWASSAAAFAAASGSANVIGYARTL